MTILQSHMGWEFIKIRTRSASTCTSLSFVTLPGLMSMITLMDPSLSSVGVLELFSLKLFRKLLGGMRRRESSWRDNNGSPLLSMLIPSEWSAVVVAWGMVLLRVFSAFLVSSKWEVCSGLETSGMDNDLLGESWCLFLLPLDADVRRRWFFFSEETKGVGTTINSGMGASPLCLNSCSRCWRFFILARDLLRDNGCLT